jgi:predicted short-subunit dehydrogenase-like oxidoreductase (DUF2520 family)
VTGPAVAGAVVTARSSVAASVIDATVGQKRPGDRETGRIVKVSDAIGPSARVPGRHSAARYPAAMPGAAPLPPVGVVGAGRVGVALAAALRGAEADVVGVVARSAAGRSRVAAELPGIAVLDLPAVAARAGLVVLAVPDDAVAAVARAVPITAGQVVAHTSGRYGIAVLGDREGRAATHPSMTFAGDRADADRLRGATFGVTADPAALPVALALVDAVGGAPAEIAEEARPLYHAALAAAANHLVTLIAESADWLRAAGVAAPAGALGPLASAALAGALDTGDTALTGPVARGDAAAVAGHLVALRAAGVSDSAVAAYAAMARRTAERARAAGRLSDAGLADLRRVLPPVP